MHPDDAADWRARNVPVFNGNRFKLGVFGQFLLHALFDSQCNVVGYVFATRQLRITQSLFPTIRLLKLRTSQSPRAEKIRIRWDIIESCVAPHVRTLKVRTQKVSIRKICPLESGAAQISISQPSPSKDGVPEQGILKIRSLKVYLVEIAKGQFRSGQPRPLQVHVRQAHTFEGFPLLSREHACAPAIPRSGLRDESYDSATEPAVEIPIEELQSLACRSIGFVKIPTVDPRPP